MGEIHGLPIGISFLGLPYSESELLGFAYALEQRLGAWEAPSLRPSVEVSAD
jgi:amidase